MTLTKYERGNTIKTEIDWKSSGVLTDTSGNKSFVDVLKPDGTYLVSGGAATRDDTGEYWYVFNTSYTDDLGIYRITWRGHTLIAGGYGYKPVSQKSQIQIVDTTG